MHRILLVEDDATIAKIIQYYLSEHKVYEVVWAKNAAEAEAAATPGVDLILLDIMLPDTDGLTLCTRLREKTSCPILFTSCIDSEDTIVSALELGGDDYLTKPFTSKILHARIQANLRRRETQKREARKLAYPDFSIDETGQAIVRGGQRVPLSPIEMELLLYMVDHPGRVITLGEIYEAVWGKKSFGDVRTVIVHVYNLRKKLEPDAGESRYIKNLRGRGYLFDPAGVPDAKGNT